MDSPVRGGTPRGMTPVLNRDVLLRMRKMNKPDTSSNGDFEKRLHFSKKLQALTNKIHATNNLDELMLDLSQDICDLFGCDRLTLYAVSKDKEFIYSKVKTGITLNQD